MGAWIWMVVCLLLLGFICPLMLWSAWVMYCQDRIKRNPERLPRIEALPRVPWHLRRPRVEATIAELNDLGFQEIGAKIERTFGFSVASRVLWHDGSRTFAGVFTSLGQPMVTFLTELDGGGLLHTGVSDRPRQVYGVVIDQGIRAPAARAFEHHQAALAELGGPAPPETSGGSYRALAPADRMQRRFLISRRYYIERFSKSPSR